MKVLSILQPWATLVVIGAKKIETRSWDTKHRGPLLIHASTKWSGELNNIACQRVFYDRLIDHGFVGGRGKHKCGLPLGKIIGQVNLINTATSGQLNMFFNDWETPTDLFANYDLQKHYNSLCIDSLVEEKFGDYSPNRYGWLLSDPIHFVNPIEAKGNLGLWDYPIENIKQPVMVQ